MDGAVRRLSRRYRQSDWGNRMTRVEDEVRAMEVSRPAVVGARERRHEPWPEAEHGGMLALEVENLRLKRVVAELLMKNQQLREQLRAAGV